jgi:hypothetical protein
MCGIIYVVPIMSCGECTDYARHREQAKYLDKEVRDIRVPRTREPGDSFSSGSS